ncbi:MAG: translocation/assembly module TamB domain-containing protein [Gemmatimonadaceae bacterium]
MVRRLRIALWTTLVLVGGLAVVVIGGGAFLLRSDWGQRLVQTRVERAIQNAFSGRGDLALHGLVLAPLGSASLDSLVLRDATGVAILSTGAVTVEYALMPLLDRVLRLRLLRIVQPRVDLVKDAEGRWNLGRVITDGTAADTVGPPRARPDWRIVLDSLAVIGGDFSITRPDREPGAPLKQTTVRGVQLALGPSTYRTLDGTGTLALRHARADLNAPPVPLRHAEGTIALWPDSVQVDLTRFALPRSRASLRGGVGWDDKAAGPRIALVMRADTVDLSEITWISTFVPTEGAGRATVRIGNGPTRGVMRYAIADLDVQTDDSHVSGRLVADVGPDIAIRDLDLAAAPLDLALVRQFFGDSVPPAPWDGTLRGRFRATGGTLDAWTINPSSLEFEDRRAGGARSRVTIAGTLDLLAPTALLARLDVTVDSLDVRTLGAVVAVADSLDGYLTGRVQLTGPVDNVRFGDLALVHHDGRLPRSVVHGSGRVATDRRRTWLEATLILDTVSVAAVGKAFTAEPLDGVVHGTLAVSARGDSMALDLALRGEGATMRFDGATSLDSTRLVLQGAVTTEGLDLRRFLPKRALPSHQVTASATLGIDGPRTGPSGPLTIILDAESELAGLTFHDGRVLLELEPGGIRVDTIAVEGPAGRISARGRLSRDPALRDSLRFVVTVDSIALLQGFLPDSLRAAWADSLGGSGRLSGVALGSLDSLDVRAELTVDDLRAGTTAVGHLRADLLLDGVPKATHGLATIDATALVLGGVPIARLSAEATVRDPAWADVSLRLVAGDTLRATARADVHYMGDSLRIQLDSLDATTPDAAWALHRQAVLFVGPDRIALDSLDVRSTDGGQFLLAMRLASAGPITLTAHASQVPLAHARFTGRLPAGIDGRVSIDADVTGTRAAPVMIVTAALDSARVDGHIAPALAFTGEYADRSAEVTVRGQMAGRESFLVTGALPLDLRLESLPLRQRLADGSLYARLVADGSPLAGLQTLLPAIGELRGAFDADVQVTGEWDNLEPRGYLLVRDGAFSVPVLGTGFRELDMDIALAPDSIVIHQARLSDERSTRDSASVEGLVVRTAEGWRADVRTTARSLRVIDDPRVAEADVSWQLHLVGPLDALVLTGDVTVPNANLIIGAQRRQILVLAEEEVEDNIAARYAPRLDGVRIRLGNEVRLRSPEANVQLTGTVVVAGTLDEPDVRGDIYATRGTYRLDLGLLQRTFQVDSGRVQMNGPLSVSPSLDIQTSYVVRQAERDDVRIGARLTGTLEQPRLVLSSADLGTTATETELISYLLFGAPSFALDGQSASAVRLATAALVPSLGGAAERALGGRIPFISELQVTTVAGDSPRDFTLNSFEGLLNSFALTAGTQIGTDSYLRLSGGVCRGENRAAQSLPAWFGVAAEYIPVEKWSAQVSLSPGSSPCNRIGTFTQIYQFGLDLFRDWRW